MVRYLYTFGIRCYYLAILVAQPFSAKARAWVSGRRKQTDLVTKFDYRDPIWVHCASLGEFEQGRPLIELIKKHNSQQQVVLTFYSPSGYQIRKDYEFADLICYLPLDTPGKASDFISRMQPRLLIMVKYDFWFNHLRVLNQKQLPFIYISLILRPGHFLLKDIAKELFELFSTARHVFTQDTPTQKLLEARGLRQVTAVGDTRIDRVITLSESRRSYPLLGDLLRGRTILIFGSVWPADMEVVAPFIREHLNGKYGFILASHEVDSAALHRIDGYFDHPPIRLSRMDRGISLRAPVISVDTIGDLAHLYHYGDLAYVGGGFGRGIHSILEPVAAGLPVIFGPNYQSFREARDLVELEGGFSIRSAQEFQRSIAKVMVPEQYKQSQKVIAAYLNSNRGASSKILHYLVHQNLI